MGKSRGIEFQEDRWTVQRHRMGEFLACFLFLIFFSEVWFNYHVVLVSMYSKVIQLCI